MPSHANTTTAHLTREWRAGRLFVQRSQASHPIVRSCVEASDPEGTPLLTQHVGLAMEVVKRNAWEVLAPHGWVVVGSFLVTAMLTPVMRALAMRFRIVDKPDDFLKPHARPIAYLGGVAIYLGWLTGLTWLAVSSPASRNWAISLTMAGGVIMLLGLADDLWNIKPWQKLLGQVLAAGILLSSNVGVNIWDLFLTALNIEWPLWIVRSLSVLTTVFVVVAASNAANLLDGLDGLCSGVTGIISVCFLVLATHMAMHAPPDRQDLALVRIVAALAMVGAVCGFLPYNSKPATIFMGDAGSMLLGLYAAAMMLMFGTRSSFRWVLGAVMMFGLPILDTSLALLRRIRLHRPIFTGDRSHLYDQLVDRSFSVRQTIAICYGLAAFYGIIGLTIILIRGRYYALIIYPVVVALTLYLCHCWGFLKPPVESPQERAGSRTPSPGDTG